MASNVECPGEVQALTSPPLMRIADGTLESGARRLARRLKGDDFCQLPRREWLSADLVLAG